MVLNLFSLFGLERKIFECGQILLTDSLYIYHHHHHHVVLVARISLTLSHHFSQSFIASGRSSGLNPASSHSCWMYVCAGRPALARPCVGVHKSTSLMSSSLFSSSVLHVYTKLSSIKRVLKNKWEMRTEFIPRWLNTINLFLPV